MQRAHYEEQAPNMAKQDHQSHNNNPDYWKLLLGDCKGDLALDVGCGTGRNVANLSPRFKEAHGCDISQGNLDQAAQKFQAKGIKNYRLWRTDGVSIYPEDWEMNLVLPRCNSYDFIMSTICLQHICVYDIRYGILKSAWECLKPRGTLSFQMGYGYLDDPFKRPGFGMADYHENRLDAKATNSGFDVRVPDSSLIYEDLVKIGFVRENISHTISHPWEDHHPRWIYVRAIK
jgi:SAM-dependent methyltransferase